MCMTTLHVGVAHLVNMNDVCWFVASMFSRGQISQSSHTAVCIKFIKENLKKEDEELTVL